MKTLTVLQNSKEWDELRKKKIGASDVSIIMGVSEFMTPFQLWQQKTGKVEKQEGENFIQNKGHKKEAKARAMFELITDREWPPVVCLHTEHEFLMASLDGYNEELNENWECKFLGKEDFENLQKGIIPQKYFPQIQAQMATTGAIACNLTGINEEDKTCTQKVNIDIEYIQTKMYPEVFKFWECVEKGIEPEKCDRDIIDLSGNKDLVNLLARYEAVKKDLSEAEALEEELKKEIFAIAKAPRNVCNGIKITTSAPVVKTTYDIDKIAEDFKVDLTKYSTQKTQAGKKSITLVKKEEKQKKEEEVKEKKPRATRKNKT